jgi:hypothetical protein
MPSSRKSLFLLNNKNKQKKLYKCFKNIGRSLRKCIIWQMASNTVCSLQLCGHMAGQRLHPFGVATATQNVIVQRIAPASISLRRQQQPTIFTFVATDVKASVQGHHPHRFVLARIGQNWQFAEIAAWRKFSEKQTHSDHRSLVAPARTNSLVKVFDAKYLICSVNREGDAVQTLATTDAAEAPWMVRFASGAQDALQDWRQAHRTLFQRVQVVLLAEWTSFKGVELLALQIDLANAANETLDVIDFVHGRAAHILADHSLVAFDANAYEKNKSLDSQKIASKIFSYSPKLSASSGSP